MSIPYRIELCGGWMDCDIVNRYCPTRMIVLSIEPDQKYMYRGGLASSTRNIARALWGDDIPNGDRMVLARELHNVELCPTCRFPSGAGDAIGVVVPGCNLLYFNNGSWPEYRETLADHDTLQFIQDHVFLYPLHPRDPNCHPYFKPRLDYNTIQATVAAVDLCWCSIQKRDVINLGKAFNNCYDAQAKLFPQIATDETRFVTSILRGKTYGCKMTGAGGGGYFIIVADEPIEGSIKFTPVGL